MSTQTRFERVTPFTTRYHEVSGEGPVPAKIMLIGERIGHDEARTRRNFIGKTGELLDTLLVAANLDRKSIYITNLVKELVDHVTVEHISKWGPVLAQEIAEVNPEIIGCLGTFATEWVLNKTRAELMDKHGVPVKSGPFARVDPGKIVLPMYHPAAALHSPETMNNVLDDFLRLAQLDAGEISVRSDQYKGKENYSIWADAFYVQVPCAIDTEGSREKPWCLTWSTQPGSAALVHTVTRSSKFAGKVYLHNSLHDLGVLRTMGVELGEGQYVDTMVLAYQLCIEPQGLKALAYRHCGMEMHSYDEIIGDSGKDKALDYLLRVSNTEWPAPAPSIVLEQGQPKIYKPQSINKLINRALSDLANDKRDKDGNPVNLRARWDKWDDDVKAPVVEVMGDIPVPTLADVDYGRASYYANRDADATLRLAPVLEQKIVEMGLTESVRVDHAIIPMLDRMQEVGIRIAKPEFWQGIEDQCDAQMGRAKYEIYKLSGHEINPGSGDQVAWLLYEQMGLRPPKMTETGTRGSVDGVALESLLGEAPIVQHIMDYTEASKIRGTYAQPFKKLATNTDRVHATIRLTRTTTGRLSMADPPLHQIPILTDLGKQLRAGFIPREGFVLGDWDVDQLEMRMCAHDSKDPELCRLFLEGRDIHAETACKIFSVPMSALSVGTTGKVNDYRRTVAKHAGFGIINGITEHGLVNYMILNRCRRPDGESWTVDDCAMMREGWFDIYKGVKRFQDECIAEAQATGLTRETISGRIMYLPAVWSPDKVVRGTAERNSYVMHTQGGGASIIKRAMSTVWREICKVFREYGVECLLQVHDELLLEVPDQEWIRETVDSMMIKALTETTKLIVPMKASGGYGMNWLEAH